MKALILYYSHSGNTRKIAQMIQKEIDCDLVEIETVNPYTGTYNDVVEQGKKEIDSGLTPEIKPLNVDLSIYDTIILGTPVWWYTSSPAIKTFLKSNDLSGKKIYPFATHGGGPGSTLKDFQKECPEATVYPGIDIYFSGKRMNISESEIRKWTKTIK